MDIELKDISYQIGKHFVLSDISEVISQGDCFVIRGSSGSGKSLLLNILCDIIKPSKGEVLVNGTAFSDMNVKTYNSFRKNTGVAFQSSALISNLSLKENLLLPLNKHKTQFNQKQKISEVEDIAHRFGLTDFLDKRTDNLSMGLASLAALARALILKPRTLFWDTPICEVDTQWAEFELNLLRQLKAHNTTLILCSNRKQVIEMATKQLCLDRR